MKISIDARGVNLYKGSGIGTYIENLLRELLNIDKKNTYSIFWAGENYNEFKKNNSKIIFTSKRHGGFYENYYYPSFIKNNNIDLIKILAKTKYGADGIGGIITKGTMYIGYPR